MGFYGAVGQDYLLVVTAELNILEVVPFHSARASNACRRYVTQTYQIGAPTYPRALQQYENARLCHS